MAQKKPDKKHPLPWEVGNDSIEPEAALYLMQNSEFMGAVAKVDKSLHEVLLRERDPEKVTMAHNQAFGFRALMARIQKAASKAKS